MTKLNNALLTCLLAMVIVALGALGWSLHRAPSYFTKIDTVLTDLDTTLRTTNTTIKDIQLKVDMTSANTNAALIQLGLAADNLRRMSTSGDRYFNNLGKSAETSAALTNQLLVHSNKVVTDIQQSVDAFNTTTLPDFNKVLVSADQQIQLNGAEVAMGLNSLNDLIKSPQITSTLTHIDGAAANAETTTAEISESVGYLRDTLKPTKRSFWARIAYGALGALGRVIW